MGGCKCSYRDCSVRSDGKTHLFHFPVFDKIRCHQWIVNTQRTDFLNLKLSQLKNRVVCQHHFKDDMFMNEMKGRLKQGALPTEDGPFCATKNTQSGTEKVLPINIEDIDNEFLSYNEKKVRMEVKYGDFLTNDVDIKDLQNPKSRNIIVDNFDKYDANIDDNINNLLQKSNTNSKNDRILLITPQSDVSTYKTKLTPKSEPLSKELEEFLKPTSKEHNDNLMTLQFNTENVQNPEQTRTVDNMNEKLERNTPNRKIKILSHKKITGPVEIEGKFEPVSVSSIIDINKKRKNNVQTHTLPDGGILVEVPPIDNPQVEAPSQNTLESKQSQSANQSLLFNDLQNNNNENIFQSFNLEKEMQNNMEKELFTVLEPITTIPVVNASQNNIPKATESSSKSLLIKSKLPPEKQAQIEEKRKYNMKVTDILDSCFKKCDDESAIININQLLEGKQKVKGSPKTPTTNSKTPKRNSFAYIEEQLQRMESNLLSKIEENTQRIVQLKHTVKPDVTKRTISTQTKEISEEIHKKQLYVEISKFLTPEANSLIFEELFINHYVEPSQKKRKVR